jgi:hypothetical protein
MQELPPRSIAEWWTDHPVRNALVAAQLGLYAFLGIFFGIWQANSHDTPHEWINHHGWNLMSATQFWTGLSALNALYLWVVYMLFTPRKRKATGPFMLPPQRQSAIDDVATRCADRMLAAPQLYPLQAFRDAGAALLEDEQEVAAASDKVLLRTGTNVFAEFADTLTATGKRLPYLNQTALKGIELNSALSAQKALLNVWDEIGLPRPEAEVVFDLSTSRFRNPTWATVVNLQPDKPLKMHALRLIGIWPDNREESFWKIRDC